MKDTESLSSLGIEKHMAVSHGNGPPWRRCPGAALALPWRCPGAALALPWRCTPRNPITLKSISDDWKYLNNGADAE